MAVENNKLIMMKIKSIEMKETAFGRKIQFVDNLKVSKILHDLVILDL